MADGRIEIDIILDDGSVRKGIANLNGLSGGAQKAGTSIKSMVTAMGLVKVASAAFGVLKNSMDGAVARFDTMQKFPKVMNALGFGAEDSSKSINKLSDGIDGLPTTLQDVVAQTQQLTSITGDLNKSTDTVIALNNAFLASGASTDAASRGMQQYNQMVSTGQVDLESWKTLQETMPLALQKTAEAMGFVGKSAQRDLYQALKDGTVTFDQFQDKLIELGTGTGMLAGLAKENALGIATSFSNLKNSIVKGMANVLTSVDTVVQALSGKSIAANIDSLKGIINTSFNAINKSIENSIPIIQKLKDSFSGGIGGDLFSNITSKIDFSSIAASFQQLKSTVLSSFSDIVSTVSQYAGSVANAWVTVFTTIGPKIIQTLTTVIGQISGLLSTVVGFVTPIIDSISQAFTKLDFSGIQTFIQAIIPALQNGLSTMFNIVKPAIQGIIDSFVNLWNVAQPLVSVLASALMPAFQVIGAFLGGVFKGILTAIKFLFDALAVTIQVLTPVISFLVDVFNFLLPVFTKVAEWVGVVIGMFTNLGSVGSGMGAIIKGAWANIQSAVSIAGNIISNVGFAIQVIFGSLGSAGNVLKGLLSSAWGTISALISSAGSSISGVVTSVMNFFRNLGSAGTSMGSIVSSAWNAMLAVIKGAVGAVSSTVSSITSLFKSLGNIDLFSIGQNIIQGLISGIGSMVGAVASKISEVAGSIKDKITGALGIHSPSRWMRDMIGKNMMIGWEIGIDRNSDAPSKAISSTMEDLKSSIQLPKISSAESLLSFNPSVSGQVNQVFKQTENNNLLKAINKMADRAIVVSNQVDSREFSRLVAQPMTKQQKQNETMKNIINGRRG